MSVASAKNQRRSRLWVGAVLIACATCVAYLPSLSSTGFILDDNANLTESPLIKASDGIYKIWLTTEPIDYWPVFNTSLWLEWRLWGMDAAGYHLTNLALHIVEVWLLWAILRRLSIPGAFVAAFFFAVHPVNVETVAWITQRKNLLGMLFVLLSTLCYLNEESQGPQQPIPSKWYWLSLAAFLLAMLSKGSVVVFPVLLLLIIGWLRPLTRRDLLRAVPFFLISAALVPINVWFAARFDSGALGNVGWIERLLGAGAAVWFYLSKALVPVGLSFVYPKWDVIPDQWRWWLPLTAAVALTWVLWRHRRTWSRPILFAWAYFCVSLAPVLGFARSGFMEHSLVADHYQHLALIGVTALLGAGWATWRQRAYGVPSWAPNAVAIAIGGVLMLLTWRQSSLYASPLTLYEATVQANPDSWMIQHDFGLTLYRAGRIEEAVEHYRNAVTLKPDDPEYHYSLGTALVRGHRLQEATEQFEEALRLQPDLAPAHNNLASALLEMGRQEEAVEHYEAAVRLEPDFANAHFNLGKVLLHKGALEQALAELQLAVRLDPTYADAQNDLAVALHQAGRNREAIEHFRRAVELAPDDPRFRANLEEVMAMQPDVHSE